jgi:heme A synthase
MVILQLVVASSMVLLHLPAVLRSVHEATGVGIWLSCFVLAYLARRVAPYSVARVPSSVTVPRSANNMRVAAARGAEL